MTQVIGTETNYVGTLEALKGCKLLIVGVFKHALCPERQTRYLVDQTEVTASGGLQALDGAEVLPWVVEDGKFHSTPLYVDAHELACFCAKNQDA